MASVRDLSKCSARIGTSYVILYLECYFKCLKWQNVVIHHGWVTHPILIDTIVTWAHALTIEHSLFPILAGLIVEVLFMLFIVYKAGWWAENKWIQSILVN